MNPAEHTEHTNRVPLTGIPVSSLGVPPMSGPSVPEYQRPLESHPREEYPPHPFEIFAWYDTVAGKTKYQVAPGAFTVNEYYFDSDIYDDTGQVFTGRSEECDVKLGVPVGPSLGIGPSSPSAEIASGDDYGVWIVIEITAGSSASVGGQGNAFFLWQREVPVVVASDNAPEAIPQMTLRIVKPNAGWPIDAVAAVPAFDATTAPAGARPLPVTAPDGSAKLAPLTVKLLAKIDGHQ
jgi:hypothetical protein